MPVCQVKAANPFTPYSGIPITIHHEFNNLRLLATKSSFLNVNPCSNASTTLCDQWSYDLTGWKSTSSSSIFLLRCGALVQRIRARGYNSNLRLANMLWSFWCELSMDNESSLWLSSALDHCRIVPFDLVKLFLKLLLPSTVVFFLKE